MTDSDKKVLYGSVLAIVLVVSLLTGYVVAEMDWFAPIKKSMIGLFR